MEICVQDDKRIVEVWLTRREKADAEVLAKLKPLTASYKKDGFLVAYYLSGERDLTEETAALLRFNKRRNAELEIRREKMQA